MLRREAGLTAPRRGILQIVPQPVTHGPWILWGIPVYPKHSLIMDAPSSGRENFQ